MTEYHLLILCVTLLIGWVATVLYYETQLDTYEADTTTEDHVTTLIEYHSPELVQSEVDRAFADYKGWRTGLFSELTPSKPAS